MIPSTRSSGPVRLRRLRDSIAATRPIDLAEAFRDLPGLCLLESARPGRNARWTYLTADPVAVLESAAAGPDPFAVARRLLARLDRTIIVPADAPRFLGGLVGYLGYDLGGLLERLPAIAPPDQDLPLLRLALHDWVVAWDRRTEHAWIGGRALDGDGHRLARRLDDVHARLSAWPRRPGGAGPDAAADARTGAPAGDGGSPLAFRSNLDRGAYLAAVRRVREHIAQGDIYQANLTRRLEAQFDADPWELYRRLRTGDPSLFSAFVALGPSQLTGAGQGGPDQGDAAARARPGGGPGARARTAHQCQGPRRERDDRRRAAQRPRSRLPAGDRPGPAPLPARAHGHGPAPRLDRHGLARRWPRRVRPPGRIVPGRVDHGSPQDPGDGDPRGPRAGQARTVHRRARLDRARRRDADEHPDPDVRGRRTPAQPARRRRDHLEERPGGRMGGDRREGGWTARRNRWRGSPMTPRHASGSGSVWVDGRLLPADGPHLSVFDRGFQLGDGIFETLRVRASHPTELAEHVARLRRSAIGLDIALPDDLEARLARGIAELLAANGLDGHDGDASVRITVSRGVYRERGLLPVAGSVPATIAIQAWPVVPAAADHLERGLHVIVSAVRRDPANPLVSLKTTSRADYVYARLEARRAGADDALFATIDGYLSEGTTANIFLVRIAPDGIRELATPSLDCAILPGTKRSWLLGWAVPVGLRPIEGRLTRDDLAAAEEAFLSSSVAGVLPVTRFEGISVGSGHPGPWTRRARADREAMIRGAAREDPRDAE
ncbi:MAG: aminotransferase class IV, partial [Chloroflexi bacterium]|nr:aminotransferase class IV [Chloroflexota bacterium]